MCRCCACDKRTCTGRSTAHKADGGVAKLIGGYYVSARGVTCVSQAQGVGYDSPFLDPVGTDDLTDSVLYHHRA